LLEKRMPVLADIAARAVEGENNDGFVTLAKVPQGFLGILKRLIHGSLGKNGSPGFLLTLSAPDLENESEERSFGTPIARITVPAGATAPGRTGVRTWREPINLHRSRFMKTTSGIIGLLLIVLGIVALAVPSVTFFTTERVADVGFLAIDMQKPHTLIFNPIVGAVALIAGIILTVASTRSRSI
jgi:hypothetical protein